MAVLAQPLLHGTVQFAQKSFSLSALFVPDPDGFSYWEWYLSQHEKQIGTRTYALIAHGVYSRGECAIIEGLVSVDTLARIKQWLEKEVPCDDKG